MGEKKRAPVKQKKKPVAPATKTAQDWFKEIANLIDRAVDSPEVTDDRDGFLVRVRDHVEDRLEEWRVPCDDDGDMLDDDDDDLDDLSDEDERMDY